KRSTKCEPMNPAPPVTMVVIGHPGASCAPAPLRHGVEPEFRMLDRRCLADHDGPDHSASSSQWKPGAIPSRFRATPLSPGRVSSWAGPVRSPALLRANARTEPLRLQTTRAVTGSWRNGGRPGSATRYFQESTQRKPVGSTCAMAETSSRLVLAIGSALTEV